jgi:hypothetical protein
VWHTNDRERTDAVLRAWESHFLHPHLPGSAATDSVVFETVEVRALPILETQEQTDKYSLGTAVSGGHLDWQMAGARMSGPKPGGAPTSSA